MILPAICEQRCCSDAGVSDYCSDRTLTQEGLILKSPPVQVMRWSDGSYLEDQVRPHPCLSKALLLIPRSSIVQ